jgi:hypothetical protein
MPLVAATSTTTPTRRTAKTIPAVLFDPLSIGAETYRD